MIKFLGTKIEKTTYGANGYSFTTYTQKNSYESVYWTTSNGLSTSSKTQADRWIANGLSVTEHREQF